MIIFKVAYIITMFHFISVSALAFHQEESLPRDYIIKLKPSSEKSFFSNPKFKKIISKVKKITKNRHNIFRIITSKDISPSNMKELQKHPLVSFIEPNKVFKNSPKPFQPKPYFQYYEDLEDQQWGLNNLKETSINAFEAWKITLGSPEVIVAVIDTGVDYHHEDLKKSIWENTLEKNGRPGVDDDQNGYIDDVHGFNFSSFSPDPYDDNGHGTHVAGIIGAQKDGNGITGVAPGVQLMPIKAFDKNSSASIASIISSIYYAIDNGAHIINNSYGEPYSLKKSSSYSEAIKYAMKRNVLFVVSAGNSNQNIDQEKVLPASINLPNVITVTAHDIEGNKFVGANYGPHSVHISAPGVKILSTAPAGWYVDMEGTSMAAPHVSGVAALILSLHNYALNDKKNNKLSSISPEQVKKIIMHTRSPSKRLKDLSISKGMLNAKSALEVSLKMNVH